MVTVSEPITEREASLTLEPAEQDLLLQDVPAFARNLKDPASRARYAALAKAVADGEIPSPLIRPLETMLELALQSKAIRNRHGPDAERTLTDLYFRTERGAGLRQAARDVTRALEAVQGQTVEKIGVTAAAGRHIIIIHTDRAHLTLSVGSNGVSVDRVEVGG